MATVIRTDIDDTKVEAGFKRMAAAAKKTGGEMVDVNSKIDTSARKSAEGLGFVNAALGRLSPQLALVGEATVKQLPTITKYGEQLKQWGLVGGAIAATAGAIGSIGNQLGKVNKESIEAGSAGENLMGFLENFSRYMEHNTGKNVNGFGATGIGKWVSQQFGETKRWAEQFNKSQEDQRAENEKNARRKFGNALSGTAQDALNRQVDDAAVQSQVDKINSVSELNKLRDEEIAKLREIGQAEVFNKEAAISSINRQLVAGAKIVEINKQRLEFDKASRLSADNVFIAKTIDQANTLKGIEATRLLNKMRMMEVDKNGELTAERKAHFAAIETGLLEKAGALDKAREEMSRNLVAGLRQNHFDTRLEDAENLVDLGKLQTEIADRLDDLYQAGNADLEDIKETESQRLAVAQKVAAIKSQEVAFQKDLVFLDTKIDMAKKVDQTNNLRSIRSQILSDTKALETLNAMGLGTDRQRKAVQDEILALKQKEADLQKKNLDDTVDLLKQHFKIFQAKDQDRQADHVAGGGGGAAGQGGGGGRQRGWQQWGGIRPPMLQDFRGQQRGQGLAGWGGGNQGGGQGGGGDDFMGELFAAPVNRGLARDIRKAIKPAAKKILQDAIAEADATLQDVIDDWVMGGNVGDKDLQNAKQGRNRAVKQARQRFANGDDDRQAKADLMADAAGDAAKALAGASGFNAKQTAALEKLAAEAADALQTDAALADRVDSVERMTNVMRQNRAALNQRLNQR